MDIAIDVGHSTVKGLSGNGARTLFPSLITPAPAAVDLGEYGQAQTTLIDGTSYLVGEPARSYAAPLWGRNKGADEDTIRLILVAAARLGAVGDVQAAAGLPLSWYASQRGPLAAALTGRQATVILPGEAPQPIRISAVRVLPQGVAAAIAVLGHPVTESDAWLVVDVGYRTTDHVMISRAPGKAMAPDLAASGTIEIGMSVVARTVAAQVEKVRGVPVTSSEVEMAAGLMIRGQKIDLTAYRHRAAADLADRLARELQQRLGVRLDRIDGILLVGGGALALADALRTRLGVPVQVPPEPQWGNASGFLTALQPVPMVPPATPSATRG